jgi:predicted O-linked N-acetylglucosamine transferase (SPINDLY family)
MTIDEAIQHYQAGNIQQAEDICKKLLKVQPQNADALYLLGVIYCQYKKYDFAIASIEKSLQLNPQNPYAYFYLGNIFIENKQIDSAMASYQKATQVDPNCAPAYNNLGNAFSEKGVFDEAIRCYQRALHLDSTYAEASYNLGNAYQKNSETDKAIRYYQEALQLGLCDDDVYYNLGIALQEQCRNDEARIAYDKALSLNPNYVQARFARCMSHLPIIYPDLSSIQICRDRYFNELIQLRDTLPLKTQQDVEAAADAIGSNQPFNLPYQGYNDRELQQIYGELVCKIMTLRYPQFADRLAIPPKLSEGVLKVGIVSGYFYLHSNWKIPIQGWVENLDRQRFSLYGYYTGGKKDKETALARRCFKKFIEDIYSFEDLCQIIRNDNLHVLIYPEIGMDPMTMKLATLRLAPVQCTSWGQPNTSGLPTIDYYISSDLMEPTEADNYYSEQLIRLPNLSVYYIPQTNASVSVRRDVFGLRPKSVLYLCCQALYKYLPQYDDIYPRIAKQVDDCQFLFISSSKSALVTEQMRSRLSQAFARYSLDATDYVTFLPHLDTRQYYAINALSDIYLDSISWSGCNTTFEAIACNSPIVTLPGEFMRGRHSSAILTMMGVTETIASTQDEYIELAVRLGVDSEWRKQISGKIADNKHHIYRDMKCISALEDFLERTVKESME